MTARPKDGQTADGPGMDKQHHQPIEIRTYEDPAVRMAYLQELHRQAHESGEYSVDRPEVFRTPGTFLLEFALGLLTEEQILEMVSSHPEAVCSTECIDERVMPADRRDNHVLSSHDGGGAAGVVAGLLNNQSATYSQAAYDNLSSFLGQSELEQLVAGLQQGEFSSDDVGRTWSKALVDKANAYAQAKGVDVVFEHQHLAVDHEHHYASMSIVDIAGEYMAPTTGEAGERPFVISNLEHLKLNSKEQSFKIMAEWAVLSLAIAWGGHSEIKDQTDLEYQVVVVVSPETRAEDEALFNRLYQEAYEAKKAGFGEHKANVSFVTPQELAGSR